MERWCEFDIDQRSTYCCDHVRMQVLNLSDDLWIAADSLELHSLIGILDEFNGASILLKCD